MKCDTRRVSHFLNQSYPSNKKIPFQTYSINTAYNSKMNIFKKIMNNKWKLRAFIPSVIFNFKYLSFSQAIHMPILIYKGKLKNMTGKIRICGPVKFGMIRLGINLVSIYPNSGIFLENRGQMTFKGKTSIGNNSAISVGETGELEFGDNFIATSGIKIACFHSVTFDENVLIGWNTQIIDSDFHTIKYEDGRKSKGYGAVNVGKNVWIANNCKVYKDVSIPDHCVVGADTILHKSIDIPSYSLITNRIETIVKIKGIHYDPDDTKIQYSKT